MKAITLNKYGSVDNFEMSDLPIPQIQKGQVRIKMMAVSFNPVDYQARKGLPGMIPVTSKILGRDLAGIVDEVHEDVTDLKKGDEVYCYVCNLASSGTYAEYICVPAAIVSKKPVSLSFEQAASIPVAGITAWLALAKTKAEQSRSIFIAGGAGGVGTFAILFAKQLGLKNIITTAGNDKSFYYLIQKLGLKKEQIVNYKDEYFIQQALELNGGYFDITLDLVGEKMLTACSDLLAIDGNFAFVTDPPGKDDFETLFHKNASFHSIGANAYSFSKNEADWKKYKHMLDHFSKLFDDNALINPPITVIGTFSVDTVKRAHTLLETTSVQGKLIMNSEL